MGTPNNRNQIGWRRLTGWVAAYLLVLHVFFTGAATGHFFAPDPGHGVTLCLSDVDGGSSSPADKPSSNSHNTIHCVLCSGGGNLLPATAVFEIGPQGIVAATLVPVSGQALALNRNYSPTQPRAPPPEV